MCSDDEQRFTDKLEERGDIVLNDDGYYVYWPDSRQVGYLDPYALRVIADYLDRKNAVWDAQVQKELGILNNRVPKDNLNEQG